MTSDSDGKQGLVASIPPVGAHFNLVSKIGEGKNISKEPEPEEIMVGHLERYYEETPDLE